MQTCRLRNDISARSMIPKR